MAIFQVKDLSFTYNGSAAAVLHDLSFEVQNGDFVVVCGASGSGKSTLLQLLKPELSPAGTVSGKRLFVGRDLAGENDVKASDIGFVLQNPEASVVADKVWHELAFGLENLGRPSVFIRRKVAEMASYFGITSWFEKKTAELSGGQKQLLNLASVMTMDPQVLLLDEPTAQLDPVAAHNFIQTLHKLNSELGLTVVMVEHRLEEVLPYANLVLALAAGHLTFAGDVRKFVTEVAGSSENPMYEALPAASRIFAADRLQNLSQKIQKPLCMPITVREGRSLLAVSGLPVSPENKAKLAISHEPSKQATQGADILPWTVKKHVAKPLLELKNIYFRYEKASPDVLKNFSLNVYRGEHLCIIGSNGAGKTTALGVMNRSLRFYSGKAFYDGKPMRKYDRTELYRHNLATLPQNPELLFAESTVEKDLLLTLETLAVPEAERMAKIRKLAREFAFPEELLQRHPYDLSGGEKQKAALLKMLLLEPRLLFLDEPTKGMDVFSKNKFAKSFQVLKDQGVSIVSVTHDIEFAARHADRVAMIFNGEVIAEDLARNFFAGNTFYTTAAARIAKDFVPGAVLVEDIVEALSALS